MPPAPGSVLTSECCNSCSFTQGKAWNQTSCQSVLAVAYLESIMTMSKFVVTVLLVAVLLGHVESMNSPKRSLSAGKPSAKAVDV